MFVYVVTRDVENQKPGMRAIPNLGIKTSEKRADIHFESILKHREEDGAKICWVNNEKEIGRKGQQCVVVRSARIENKNGDIENLRIEKWRL